MRNPRQPSIRIPFLSRAYGGFTKSQEQFYREVIGDPAGKAIFDPMAGQAFALSLLAHAGASVWLGDIDPAPILLANLRDPSLLQNASDLCNWFDSVLRRLARKRRPRKRTTRFYDGWVAPEIRLDLSELAEQLGFGLFTNPFEARSDLWNGDPRLRFAAGLIVLAARSLACYRATDNVTWLKPGGLVRHARALEPLRNATDVWKRYAEATQLQGVSSQGEIKPRLMDISKGDVSDCPKVPLIVTSPPYANRLDYTRLWGPELNVLSALCSGSPDRIKAEQIGSTVVEGTGVNEAGVSMLPKTVQAVLDEIRKSPAEYSDVYYYPFFRNYAVSLRSALVSMAGRLKAGGKLFVFVRDTARKDVLFPTGDFVRAVLRSPDCSLREYIIEQRVIRGHIGYLRKASTRGVLGLAQREWWIVFEKRRAERGT